MLHKILKSHLLTYIQLELYKLIVKLFINLNIVLQNILKIVVMLKNIEVMYCSPKQNLEFCLNSNEWFYSS